jgi:magnesium transporter
MIYFFFISAISLYFIYFLGPKYGKKHMLIYITVCSLVGSISVMAVKGLAVAVKITFAGDNQFGHPATWIFLMLVVGCAMTQINYFNKALDLFSTNRVTPSISNLLQSITYSSVPLQSLQVLSSWKASKNRPP